jgi:hypothetical protein
MSPRFLQPGEELLTVGWASEKGFKYYYVALTNQRLILVRFSMTYKVKDAESISLPELEAASIYEGFEYAPIDIKLLSSMVETSLYIKTKDGGKKAFRFPVVLGLNNKEVPVEIMETLKLNP